MAQILTMHFQFVSKSLIVYNSKGILSGLVVKFLALVGAGNGPAFDQNVEAKFLALMPQKLERGMVLKIVRLVHANESIKKFLGLKVAH